jgi:hypothetical protein
MLQKQAACLTNCTGVPNTHISRVRLQHTQPALGAVTRLTVGRLHAATHDLIPTPVWVASGYWPDPVGARALFLPTENA